MVLKKADFLHPPKLSLTMYLNGDYDTLRIMQAETQGKGRS